MSWSNPQLIAWFLFYSCYIKHEGFVTYGDNKILQFSLALRHIRQQLRVTMKGKENEREKKKKYQHQVTSIPHFIDEKVDEVGE